MAVLSLAPIQFISSIPLATRIFTATTLVFTALYYFLLFAHDEGFTAPYLVLIPGSSVFYPWVFFTSALVETSIIEVRTVSTHGNPCLYPFSSSSQCSRFLHLCATWNDYGVRSRLRNSSWLPSRSRISSHSWSTGWNTWCLACLFSCELPKTLHSFVFIVGKVWAGIPWADGVADRYTRRIHAAHP